MGLTDEPILPDAPIALPDSLPNHDLLIVTSSLLRCRQTSSHVVARLLSEHPDASVEIKTLDSLRERDYGAWTGRDTISVREENPAQFVRDVLLPSATPPGGESFEHFTERVDRFLIALEGIAPGCAGVVVCSHLQVLRLITCRLNEWPIEDRWATISYANGTAVEL